MSTDVLHSSTGISIIVHRHRSRAVRPRDVQEALEYSTGGHVDRVRPTQEGMHVLLAFNACLAHHEFVQDYQEHQNEIHAKLIAIMGDRLAVHIGSLQGIDWDTPPANPGVNDYMEVLVKETVTLHKLLSRYLSVPIVEVSISPLVG